MKEASSHSRLAGASTVLVSESPDATNCASLRLLDETPADLDLLFVTYRPALDRWVANWRSTFGDLPARFAMVHAGGVFRSASASPTPALTAAPFTIDAVSSPTDLTELGTTVDRYLSAWRDDNRDTVLWYKSVTSLLQYANLRTTYRFVNALRSRVDATGGTAYFFIEPAAHDERTVATLRTLFDASVELYGDDVRVRFH